MSQALYKDKMFKAWNINLLAEALTEEWSTLQPQLSVGIRTGYGSRATRISFAGEVCVTIDISAPKISEADSITPLFNLSLSQNPDSTSTHVLNTFQFKDFMALFSELSDKKMLFAIGKTEPWEASHFARAAQLGLPMLAVLLKFETCFNFLISDTYEVAGEILDARQLQVTHYLNRVRAYRLAEIYNHPEKLPDAIRAIRQSADINDTAKQRLDRVCATRSAGSAGWLYTPEMIEELCK